MLIRTLRSNPWTVSFDYALELLDIARALETFFWMVLALGRPGREGAQHLTIIAPSRSHRVLLALNNPIPLSSEMRTGLEQQARDHLLLTYSSLDEFLRHKAPRSTYYRNSPAWEHGVVNHAGWAYPTRRVPQCPSLLAFLEALLDPHKRCPIGCEVCQAPYHFSGSWSCAESRGPGASGRGSQGLAPRSVRACS